MPTLVGGCHCGNVAVSVRLTHAPSHYQPRECDCEFCRKHAAAYLSDPHGTLQLQLREAPLLGRYRQGSGAADMLLCRRCGVLLGALYQDGKESFGVVNVRCLGGTAAFGAVQPVSPQRLTAVQKAARWRELWFREVGMTDVA